MGCAQCSERLLETGDQTRIGKLDRLVAVVSPYRAVNEDVMTSGASALNWYTAHLCASLAERGENVCVIAPISDGAGRPWNDGDVPVYPAYRKGSIFFAIDIVRTAIRVRATTVHVQFELFAFGGIAQALSIPVALAVLRLFGIITVTTFHGLPSSKNLTPAFLKRNGIRLPTGVVALCLRLLGSSLAATSSRLIVHQESQRRMISEEYGAESSVVIPIGVDVREPLPRDVGRTRFNIPADAVTIMFFGYFASYKGLEELLPAVNAWIGDSSSNYFVFGGSAPQRDAGRTLESLGTPMPSTAQIVVTGFVPDRDVALVFGMVDAIVLPYTINMAASGPMNIALGYGVPIMLSTVFSNDYDARYSFEPTREGILDALRSFSSDRGRRLLLKEEVLRTRSSRSWKDAAGRTSDLYRDVGGNH